MRTVDAKEAKTHFSKLLAEVAAGATVEITSHGAPVARLVPIRHDFAAAAAAIDEWRRYRDEHHVTLGEGITIREFIEDGRDRRTSRSTLEYRDEDSRSL
jgi:prevent-host-death family protein